MGAQKSNYLDINHKNYLFFIVIFEKISKRNLKNTTIIGF